MARQINLHNSETIFVGDSEMARLMRSHDWSLTPLGPVETWPQSLRSALSICLNSRFPIAIYWGQDCILLYNDAWRPIVGNKHSWALGHPAREVWSEIWDDIGPELASVLATGKGTFHQDDLLSMHRFGYTEECFFEYTFNPIQGEGGVVEGVFNIVTETTYRVLNDRRARLLREVASQTAIAKTAEAVCASTLEAFKSDRFDLPLALLYLIDPDGKHARRCNNVIESALDGSVSPAAIDLAAEDDPNGWPIAIAVRTAQLQEVRNLESRFGTLPGSPWPEPLQEAMVLPIAGPGYGKVSGVLVAVASPRRRLDDRYRDFFTQVAAQIAMAIANAQAYEEERKRAEALAEIDRAKTTFFSNVSHEFRTPLTLMLGPLEETLSRLELPPTEREQLQMVHRNGLRLLKLVNTLLDFSRIEAGRIEAVYEPTDLAAFTAELASVFRSAIERAGLRLVVDCPPLPEPIYVDREMWEKIVLNLLSNAFKFTFEGEIAVILHFQGDRVELEVRDTGTGIPTEELPHIFERFHRVKRSRGRSYEGSGIGLSLVRELVRLHGGTIEVSSVVDRGTTFTVSIPTGRDRLPSESINATRTLTSTATGAMPYVEEILRWLPESIEGVETKTSELSISVPVRPRLASTPTARILLADDNADMRDYLKRLLSQQYEVEAVADGIVALSAIGQQIPDLVLTDVMMPRLDGFGLLQALRAEPQTQELPIILLSARAGEEARIEGLAAGADDYLTKPFSARELLARVEANLKLARLRREATQREQALRLEAEAAQQKVETILASISDAFVVLDRNWNFTYVNDRYCEIVGMERSALWGQNVWQLFPDTANSEVYEQFQQALSQQTPVRFEWLFPAWNRWFEYRVYPSPDGLTIFIAEITARKQAEIAIREGEKRLQLAVEAGRMVAWEWNPFDDSIITSTNFPEIYGLTAIQSAEQGFALLHPEDRSQHEAIVERAVAAKSSYHSEFRFIRPDTGAIVWLEERGQPILNDNGSLQKLIGVTIDITDRQRGEAERGRLWQTLAGERAQFEAVLRQMPEGVMIADGVSGQLVLSNERANQILQYDYDLNLEIERYEPIVPFQAYRLDGQPYAADEYPLARSLRAGEVVSHEEMEICFQDGRRIFLDVKSSPIFNSQGQIISAVTVFQDITDRKQAEAEREQLLAREQAAREAAEAANRIKDEFLAIVSHELRSPLNPIVGWSKLLRTRQLSKEKTELALETIERNAQIQAQLIDDLLDVSRILRGKLSLDTKPVDLAFTIQSALETVRLAAEAKSIEIHPQFAPNIGRVSGDPGRLQQIIWNLLSNAVKFTSEGGRVDIRLERIEIGQRERESQGEYISSAPLPLRSSACSYAQITVSDTGKGIHPDFLPHVFEQFRQESAATTRRFGGLGLGLAIVRYLVELHGGTVGVASPGEGRGATFTVKLPLMPHRSAIDPEPKPAAPPLDLHGLRILIVDDDTSTREFLAFLLELHQANAIAVASAAEAMATLTQFLPDVLLSDIGMPDVDGYMLMRQIRALPPERGGNIPAIALTAYAGEIDYQQAMAAGFQRHLTKPIEPQVLIQAISALCGKAKSLPSVGIQERRSGS